MKEVLDIYGKFFLEGLVIGLLFINIVYGVRDDFGNNGVFQIIGNNLPVKEVKHIEYVDFRNIYKDECDKSFPQIFFLGKHLEVGNNKISDYFVAYDYAGRELPIVINRILDAGGSELSDIYNTVLNELYFQEAGIYILETETQDNDNRIMRYEIKIPVCL